MRFASILFPVDFSERSMGVASKVRAVRKRYQASLTLLHVLHVPAPVYGTLEAPMYCCLPLEDLKENAHNRLLEFSAAAFPGEVVLWMQAIQDRVFRMWRAGTKTT